jgi:hypothetical protein
VNREHIWKMAFALSIVWCLAIFAAIAANQSRCQRVLLGRIEHLKAVARNPGSMASYRAAAV